jgi:hypothetical protein
MLAQFYIFITADVAIGRAHLPNFDLPIPRSPRREVANSPAVRCQTCRFLTLRSYGSNSN